MEKEKREQMIERLADYRAEMEMEDLENAFFFIKEQFKYRYENSSDKELEAEFNEWLAD